MTDTIARSEDEYVEIAVGLARDPRRRADVVAGIGPALPGDHVAAMEAYTRSLQDALLRAVAPEVGAGSPR